MDFYKKTIFLFIIFLFFTIVLVKILEPVFDRQVSKLFEGKKISIKIQKELEKGTEDFTQEKRIFYKKIIKKTYMKWKPLIDEAINEANKELSVN